MQQVIDSRWVQEQLAGNINRVLNPSVCRRVLTTMQRPDATFSDVARDLTGDPYISAKVMAVAELAGRHAADDEPATPAVCSIDRAVALLGVRQVEALVLAVMLAGPLTSRPYHEHRDDIWRYIFGCAAAGDWLIRRFRKQKYDDDAADGESIVCGLMLGLGVQLLYGGLGTRYSRLLGVRLQPVDLADHEREKLGVDHHQVTAWALETMLCPAYLSKYPQALARLEQGRTADEARAVELLACRAAGFQTMRSTTLLRELLTKLHLDKVADEVEHELPAVRRRVGALARAFKVELKLTGEYREQLNRETTRRAGRHLDRLVQDEARRKGEEAA